jgi:hypothetical protein
LKPEGDIFADPSIIPHQLAGVFFVVAGDPEGNQFANFRGSDLRGVAHVLLWFAVVAFDVIKMNEIMHPVYRENRFSVDFEENPMFMRVKQGSLFCDQDEFGEELDLRTAVDLAVVDPAVDHGVPFSLADTQLGVQADYFDFDGWLGFVEETHR